jgi:hypothetical protein
LVFVANRCCDVSGAFIAKSHTQRTKRKYSARYPRRGCTGDSIFVCCDRFWSVHCCSWCGRVLLGIFRFGRLAVRIVITCPDVGLTQRDHVTRWRPTTGMQYKKAPKQFWPNSAGLCECKTSKAPTVGDVYVVVVEHEHLSFLRRINSH